MPHASLPSRINSSPSFHHRPSTLSPFHPSPHARPVHFCSLDKTPRNAREKSRLRPLFLDEGALTAPAASPFLPPLCRHGDSTVNYQASVRRLLLMEQKLIPPGEGKGLVDELWRWGRNVDRSKGVFLSNESLFWGPMIETLLTILFFTACVISSSMD